jgi:hypothetical protein
LTIEGKLREVREIALKSSHQRISEQVFDDKFKTNFKHGMNSLGGGKIYKEISKNFDFNDDFYTGASSCGFSRIFVHSFV